MKKIIIWIATTAIIWELIKISYEVVIKKKGICKKKGSFTKWLCPTCDKIDKKLYKRLCCVKEVCLSCGSEKEQYYLKWKNEN
jgi:uncharacterized protein YjcR